jgi:hypothetical protein
MILWYTLYMACVLVALSWLDSKQPVVRRQQVAGVLAGALNYFLLSLPAPVSLLYGVVSCRGARRP